ncbi:MAG: hypothetical protein UU88_C0001G0058 [Parcubacteria group bacterium GW2011_GWC1_42_11]|uniref:Uncharacterized protein n=1 Tax=Candidatus Nomurabacteria bacterium GW2011_GWC2_42_20 TaxID=1618756 RepID=A0A0G0ZG06_9BACT|nr:MAG: hypothetical protein UU88_C0001G0058 [Parcubacteria group bacterium GW2011_GWC1_42_11]KKS47637.1 MAG: hypothetical protein UV12_C0006G0061 [Candidatus Nomurabacteria bacterium GW2011_GWC2_42_20]KKS58435.1 MAG: hypothetical protein UV24_C0023G0019 [Candidatus Nomurabacteria bacterium GW2011_GWA2_42_41]KKT09239.1 MAG: hypothetical protein UV86_C0011G0023 [Candidatus Nomurabacteria bacterium GW2011_GWB1_43_20]
MGRINKIKNEGERITSEVRDRSMTYIAGGLGIVVGLAWNEAIKSLIDYFYPASGANSISAKFIYAIIITTVVVLVTMYIVRPPKM